MPVKAKDVKILIDEFDLSGASNSVSVSVPVDAIPAPAFQQTGLEQVPGMPKGMIDHKGYYNGAGYGYMEKVFYDRLGTETPAYVAAMFDTGATIKPTWVIDSTWAGQLKLDAPIAGLLTVEGNWQTGEGIKRGYVLWEGTISATGAKTGSDFAVAGSNGGDVYIFVQTITGTSTGTIVKVQSDSVSNFATVADEAAITFTAIGAAHAAMSGSIGRYVRINLTNLGGATSVKLTVIACVNGVTQ